MKTHRQYIKEQIQKRPKFAGDLAEADREVAIAVGLAQLREHRGFSQQHLAMLTGMKQPQIARLESGAYFPALATLQKLLGALSATMELTATDFRLIDTQKKVASLRR